LVPVGNLARRHATTSLLVRWPRTVPDTSNGYDQPYWFWAPPTFAGGFLFIGNQDGTLRAFGP
jgi:hypothetical protein